MKAISGITQIKWALIFIAAVILLTGMYLLLVSSNSGRTAVITSDGKTVMELGPDDLESSHVYVIETGDGHSNTVCVSDGKIFVRDADCPDGVCVDHGPLEEGGTPIICLPNRLVIRWSDDTDDGVDN